MDKSQTKAHIIHLENANFILFYVTTQLTAESIRNCLRQ